MAGERYRRQGGVQSGVIAARPGPAPGGPAGERPLGLDGERDGLIYVPASAAGPEPAPLAVCLHGAGDEPRHALDLLADLADRVGLILLAPASRGTTWDVIAGGYGPDVAFIDRALAHVFSQYAVDRRHLAVSGFSDGASYALSLGIMNGALFSHVIAFSPGFMAPLHQEGAPRLFVSHGQADSVLSIDVCSRRLVPLLEGAGYNLRYREFSDGHTVPAAIAAEAVAWLMGHPEA